MTARDHDDDEGAADSPLRKGLVQHYGITVKGHLAPRWSTWFDGLELTPTDDGNTVIAGPIVDQAALHGLLQKLRDLGIPLLSLAPISPNHSSQTERH